MADQLSLRGGTTTEHNSFTGANKEVTVDTTKKTLVVHDGATAGGHPIMRENGSNSALSLGSAATPSLKFSGDTNTGLYSPGADQVAISTGGTERLLIKNVSQDTLRVSGINAVVTADAVSSSYPGFRLASSGSTFAGLDGAAGTSASLFTFSALPLLLGTNSTERLRITSDGKVGIGTSAPTVPLTVVAGSSNTDVAIFNGSTGTSRGLKISTGIYFNSDALAILDAPEATYGSLMFRTRGTNALFIDPSQQVGIGTTPARLFHVSGSGTTTRLTSSTATSTLEFETTGGFAYIGAKSGPNIYVETNGSERLRIDSSGRLLVGTSSSSASAAAVLQGFAGIFAKSNGTTVGSNTLVASGDTLGEIFYLGNDGTEFVEAAKISAQVDGTPGANDMPGRLVFSTTADGASSPTERMRIQNNGVILARNSAGDTLNLYNPNSAGASNAFIYGLHSSASAYTGTTSFIVYTNGNVVNTNGSYTTLSDAKLKENIVSAGSQWDDIKAIQIRNWNFKVETGNETHRQIGPIAQEVEAICPGLVFEIPDRDQDGNETGEVTKGINQSVLYMKAVKALQEAMERIETLEAKVAALEGA